MPTSKPQVPRLTSPSLVALEDGDPAAVASGDDVDGLRVIGGDLTGVRLER